MRDIWVVSSLQLPGHVAEDGVSRCQWDTPSLGLYARTWIVFPHTGTDQGSWKVWCECSAVLGGDGLLKGDPSTAYNLKNVFYVRTS